MKKLKLRRETIAILTDSNLGQIQGGATIISIPHTMFCPVLTNGCTGGCQETLTNTSIIIINPGSGG